MSYLGELVSLTTTIRTGPEPSHPRPGGGVVMLGFLARCQLREWVCTIRAPLSPETRKSKPACSAALRASLAAASLCRRQALRWCRVMDLTSAIWPPSPLAALDIVFMFLRTVMPSDCHGLIHNCQKLPNLGGQLLTVLHPPRVPMPCDEASTCPPSGHPPGCYPL